MSMTDDTARAEADATATTEDGDALANWGVDAPAKDGWTMADADDVTTEDLTGARVYDAEDNWIGEVDRLKMAEGGEIDEAIIDVGGFLGIGEKPVAMTFEDMNIQQAEDGNEVRVYLDTTKDRLMEMPEYEG